jgi:Fe2+ or Zn2+ uptake regulation protein
MCGLVSDALERTLVSRGIQPSAQRLAVARYVLATDAHPSADRVLAAVRARMPEISRATVYNTLNLLVAKGLLRQLVLGGKVVFDPNVEAHHHFVDERSGTIHDLPWDALEVRNVDRLKDLDVREVQVVLRGTWRKGARPGRARGVRRASGPPPLEPDTAAPQLHRMSEHEKQASENEGEGSRSADRHYREKVQETVRRGRVADDAERARRDVDADPEEYRRAEDEGRSRSAGEAPGDLER